MEVALLQLLITHLQRQVQVGVPHQLCKFCNGYERVHKKLCHVNRVHHLLDRALQHLIRLHRVSLDPLAQDQRMIGKLRMELRLDLFRNLNFAP